MTVSSGLVSYAVGTLMGSAFLVLLPYALLEAEVGAMLQTALAGFVVLLDPPRERLFTGARRTGSGV
jgi:hypothetical protein